jgi:hypothetical protein
VENLSAVEKRMAEAIRRTLKRAAGPSVTVTDLPGGRLLVSHGSAQARLAPVWAGEGYPRDVKDALSTIDGGWVRQDERPVIVAQRMSPGARAVAEALDIAWLDASGSCRINIPPGLLVVVDVPPVPAPSVPGASLRWAEAPGAIAEYLLGRVSGQAPDDDRAAKLPSVVEIGDALEVSATLVSRALRMFDSEGWTRKLGPERGPRSSRELVEPGALLSSWASWHQSGRRGAVDAHKLIRNSDVFLDVELPMAWEGTWWAMTGAAALERRAPFLTSLPVLDLYVEAAVFSDDEALDGLLDRAALRRVDSGARVRIHPADRYLPRLTPSAARQVGDIRLYGDLLRFGVRGQDAAEHLRETRIGF